VEGPLPQRCCTSAADQDACRRQESQAEATQHDPTAARLVRAIRGRFLLAATESTRYRRHSAPENRITVAESPESPCASVLGINRSPTIPSPPTRRASAFMARRTADSGAPGPSRTVTRLTSSKGHSGKPTLQTRISSSAERGGYGPERGVDWIVTPQPRTVTVATMARHARFDISISQFGYLAPPMESGKARAGGSAA
jgi:hypothetical protein